MGAGPLPSCGRISTPCAYTVRPPSPMPSSARHSTSWGTLSETGGALALYHPGMGYGTLSVTTLLTGNPPSFYGVYTVSATDAWAVGTGGAVWRPGCASG